MVDAEVSLQIEPELDEILSDPIVHLVMRRDGLTVAAVLAAIETASARLARPPETRATPPTAGEPEGAAEIIPFPGASGPA